MWADLVVELPPSMRLGADAVALAALIVLLGIAAVHAIRLANPAALARRVDDVADAGGQVLAGVDLSMTPQVAGAATVTAGLANIAIDRATGLVQSVSPTAAVSTRPAKLPFVVLLSIVGVLALGGLFVPRMFATQWLRFADPYGDHPPYTRLALDVVPHGTRVIYGKSFDVQVKTDGPAPER